MAEADVNPPVKLPFRDGERWVPAHLAELMTDIETYKLTYDEARRSADTKLTRDYVGNAFDEVIAGHFRERR